VERGGSLVNISSAAGAKGTPPHIPYTASTHGVVGLSMALANELATQSIRVNTLPAFFVEPVDIGNRCSTCSPMKPASSSAPNSKSMPE